MKNSERIKILVEKYLPESSTAKTTRRVNALYEKFVKKEAINPLGGLFDDDIDEARDKIRAAQDQEVRRMGAKKKPYSDSWSGLSNSIITDKGYLTSRMNSKTGAITHTWKKLAAESVRKESFPIDQFMKGLEVEGKEHPEFDAYQVAEIVLDHLKKNATEYSEFNKSDSLAEGNKVFDKEEDADEFANKWNGIKKKQGDKWAVFYKEGSLPTRSIDGQKYDFVQDFGSEHEAHAKANELEQKGADCEVVPSGSKYAVYKKT